MFTSIIKELLGNKTAKINVMKHGQTLLMMNTKTAINYSLSEGIEW